MAKNIWEDPKELEKEINEYFDQCEGNNQIPTLTGLFLHIDFYEKGDKKNVENVAKEILFGNFIDRAKQRIKSQYVQLLVSGKGSAAGLIFALKNEFGWKD